jgi:cell division protein FtsI (penicillin-binding protein 3)
LSAERPLVHRALAGDGPPPRERQMRLRMMLLALSVSLWALVVGIRLVQLQVLDRAFFEQQGTRQSERTVNLYPRRGPILDRDGRPLAVSVDAESVYAVPQDIADPQGTAVALARALGQDAAARRELVVKQQKSAAFVWIERKVDPATAERIRSLQLDGIGFVTEHRRYYPQRELAAQVLGYVGLDNAGMAGLEYLLE